VEKPNFISSISEKGLDICKNADNFLQSEMWGIFKSRFGWEARGFSIVWENKTESSLLVLIRIIAPMIYMAYIPWGPMLGDSIKLNGKMKALAELSEKIYPFFKKNVTFIRFDPPWLIDEDGVSTKLHNSLLTTTPRSPRARTKGSTRDDLSSIPREFHRAAADIQPPDTVLINLQQTSDDILSSMKPKWRYNIKLAEKKGVMVKIISDIGVFYSLLKETAKRDGISIHNIEYYQTLYNLCDENETGNVKIYLYAASHESDTLAAIIVLYYNKTATYLYGASSSVKRNLMAPYALQWRAMRDAKDAGCETYDLFGIPPDDNPNHPMSGLYLFKTGFGGEIIRRPGSLDYAYKPLLYFLFKTAEAARKKIRGLKKKR